jgi:MFS family permease
MSSSPSAAPLPKSFAALQSAGFRPFILLSAAAMLADNIEHVITYYAAYQKFHSPTLGGIAVIAHWAPYLLLSIPVGALADRVDPRRVIQAGMALFMAVSIAWALLIATGRLEIWHAAVLLVLHGIAGVLWLPPSQLLLYDIVGPAHLQSAVRLNATVRYLGPLIGPALGSALLLSLGPSRGLFVNAAIYLPFLLWLWKAPYGHAYRGVPGRRAAIGGLRDVVATLRAVRGNRALVSMMLLSGGAAFFVGNAYQAQMPKFAADLGEGRAGVTYAMLLGADACGALLGGLILESRSWLRMEPGVAVTLAILWCAALATFALTDHYALAIASLLAAGFLELSFNSMAQTLVQLNAPNDIRGRVIGVYSMASLGSRTFSGISVGLVGGLIGVHYSLAIAAGVLSIGLVVLRRRLTAN